MLTTNDICHHLRSLSGVQLNLLGDFEPGIHAIFLSDGVYPPFFDVKPLSIIPQRPILGSPVMVGYTYNMKFYSFTTTVMDTTAPNLVLSVPDKLNIVQRRNYIRVRFPDQRPVVLCLSDRHIFAAIYDISQGGICVVVKEALSSGAEVSLRIANPKGSTLLLKGTVGHCLPFNGKFKCGIKFTSLHKELSESLGFYIAGLQKNLVSGVRKAYADKHPCPC